MCAPLRFSLSKSLAKQNQSSRLPTYRQGQTKSRCRDTHETSRWPTSMKHPCKSQTIAEPFPLQLRKCWQFSPPIHNHRPQQSTLRTHFRQCLGELRRPRARVVLSCMTCQTTQIMRYCKRERPERSSFRVVDKQAKYILLGTVHVVLSDLRPLFA